MLETSWVFRWFIAAIPYLDQSGSWDGRGQCDTLRVVVGSLKSRWNTMDRGSRVLVFLPLYKTFRFVDARAQSRRLRSWGYQSEVFWPRSSSTMINSVGTIRFNLGSIGFKTINLSLSFVIVYPTYTPQKCGKGSSGGSQRVITRRHGRWPFKSPFSTIIDRIIATMEVVGGRRMFDE